MSILSGLFRSRDKPTNSINGNDHRFLLVVAPLENPSMNALLCR